MIRSDLETVARRKGEGSSSECILCMFCDGFELVNALDELWRNWNKSTPDLSTNLPGWSSTGPDNTAPDPCYYTTAAWRGVECLQKQRNGSSSVYDAFIVGL